MADTRVRSGVQGEVLPGAPATDSHRQTPGPLDSARDDRVSSSMHDHPSVAEFDAPTFRKGRERWGTPRSWSCRRSAENWPSISLPCTDRRRIPRLHKSVSERTIFLHSGRVAQGFLC